MIGVDDMLPYVGECSYYQYTQAAVLCVMNIAITSSGIYLAYFGVLDSPWECHKNSTVCNMNGTYFTGHPHFDDRCTMSREDWHFIDLKSFSIVTEFDLHCDTFWLAEFFISSFYIGWIFGSSVMGWLSDRFGRRVVLFSSTAVTLFITFTSAFSPSLWLLIISRFVVGFCLTGCAIQGFIMTTEMVGHRHRSMFGSAYWIAGVSAYAAQPLIAYFIQRWRILYIACSAPFFFVLCFVKIIPESVRWLHIRGHDDKAMDILNKVARWNKKVIPQGIQLDPISRDISKRNTNICSLFGTKHLSITTSIEVMSYVLINVGFYALSLASGQLGGSLYLNFFLVVIIEIPSNVAVAYSCEYFGRKKTVVFPTVLSSILCLLIAFIPTNHYGKTIRTIMAILGRFFLTVAYNAKYIWTVEIYPSTMRATANGFMLTFAPIGGMVAPWIANYSARIHPYTPFISMAIVTCVAGLLMLWLAETKGQATAEVDVITHRDKQEME